MSQAYSPLPFQLAFEEESSDEAETQDGLTEAMLSIASKTYADTGHAHRAVHAKAHGYLRARFEVLPDLPAELAQGLFARPANYEAIMRFSTTPGDLLDDNVSVPRGVAIKVLNVPGTRLSGSEGESTQNYVLGNSPSFQVATAKAFLKQLRPLAATTGEMEGAKHVASVLSRTVAAALGVIGQKSATLTMLAGQAPTHILGDSFYSQGPLLHGEYYSKVALSPASDDLIALSGKHIDLSGHPDAIREGIQTYFLSSPAVWDFKVQLATSIKLMPVEDAAVQWPESESPYRTVARISASPQQTWADEMRELVEEHFSFNPWIGLAAHRPLGSIMRARRPAYAAAREFRELTNKTEIKEPLAVV